MPRIEILIKKHLLKNYKLIDNINVVDIPGIDDGFLKVEIENYIDNEINYIIPVIVFSLTCGGFKELTHFTKLIMKIEKMHVSPVIVFTMFEQHLKDIKNVLRDA